MGGTDPGLAQVFTTLLCERLLRKNRAQLEKLHLEGEDRFIEWTRNEYYSIK